MSSVYKCLDLLVFLEDGDFFRNIDNYPLKLSTKRHIPFDFILQNYSQENSKYRMCYFSFLLPFSFV